MEDERQRLLAAFRADRNHDAFHGLVRPHVGAMRSLARRLTRDAEIADDLVQEALIRAFRHLGDLEQGPGALRTWLFRIVVRLGLEPDRWSRRERFASPDAHERVADLRAEPRDDPVRPVLERELRERLAVALSALPQRQQAAIHLRAAEGLDYRGVADAMGCSVGAARMLVLEARRRLLDAMQEDLEP
jgi:RNA polymerase sigma-70 factor (ECF subfamily)